MTHPDTLQIPRAVVEQALEAMEESVMPFNGKIPTKNYNSQVALRAALQPLAAEPKLYRLMHKDGAAWFPASEWMTEVDASWAKLAHDKPDEWRINEPLNGKKVADVFAKALQPQAAEHDCSATGVCVQSGLYVKAAAEPVAGYVLVHRKVLNKLGISDAVVDTIATPPTHTQAAKPVAYLIYAGVCDMSPVYPAHRTLGDAQEFAGEIKSVTKIVPLYTTPPATQAALTAALNTLRVLVRGVQADSPHKMTLEDVATIGKAAIAQIEALKGPTP